MSAEFTSYAKAIVEDAAFLMWLKIDSGFLNPKPLPGNRWAAVWPLMFTHAVVTGAMHDYTSIEDRWCYSDRAKALKALEDWDGSGEPTGWHRHPASGRRVDELGQEWTAP